ncbi:MAG: VOC family protein [Bacteriovoracaceae bacterium]
MNPVGWFEIPVSDIRRATSFYEKSLNMKLSNHDMEDFKMSWFPMEQDKVGATGALVQGQNYQPSKSGSRVYLSCDDIDATLKRIQQNGGKILSAKRSIGEYGFMAEFEDSEGNLVSLHSKS